MRLTLLASFLLITYSLVQAQPVLPKIEVKTISGKTIITWKNNYTKPISNISIQRSNDSIRYFSTIGTVFNPLNSVNGFVDAAAPSTKVYYRLFIAFEGGDYEFTQSLIPIIDTGKYANAFQEANVANMPVGFIASQYIYTGRDNNVIINLPDAERKKYSIKFFDASNKFVFGIKKISENYLTIEKVNFIHAGWYNFQLFENKILIEKHEFYIPKDLK